MHPKIFIRRMEIASTSSHEVKFSASHVRQWQVFLEEAKAFRKKHGHCIISLKTNATPELARWARRQRFHFKQYKNQLKGIQRPGQKVCPLTPERVAALNEIGFCWDAHEVMWNERFNQLKEFHRLNGHFNVPPGPKRNNPLATWIRQQRYEYRLREQGKNHSITTDRIERLTALGFVWVAKHARVKL